MKNLLFIFAFTCLTVPAIAQFSIGLSAGANLTYWKWHIKPLDTDLDFESAIGYRAAVLGEWQMSPLFALRAEIATQLKSNKKTGVLEFAVGESTAKYRENYQYWEGTVLAQVSPVKKFRNAYLVAGATFGRLTDGWLTFEGKGPDFENNKVTRKDDIDISNPNFNRNSIAADFGLGGNIPLGGHSSLKLEARYQYSLTNFSTSENVEASANPLIFSVGYLHRL